ncbi:hypothetical protein ACFHWD_20065 [Clostridium sp. MT-14]|uniref:Bacteriocin n=1 Tax=Clostridium aromativorans TaxID=2836848 RepID=A0ABS8N6S5_9CLOT|nr:hypothetical protein [Clostridium aromativorans]MCC9295525.1 hypothetical protein [Clostridium aromativorans]
MNCKIEKMTEKQLESINTGKAGFQIGLPAWHDVVLMEHRSKSVGIN